MGDELGAFSTGRGAVVIGVNEDGSPTALDRDEERARSASWLLVEQADAARWRRHYAEAAELYQRAADVRREHVGGAHYLVRDLEDLAKQLRAKRRKR